MRQPLREIILKVLEEVDEDIKEYMLDVCDHDSWVGKDYERWEYSYSPVLEILEWQKLRDRKK